MVWFATTVGTDMSYLDMLGPFVVGGLGVSMAIPCGQSAAVAAVADRDVATASGVNSTMRELGGVLGIAVTVAVFGAVGGYASPGRVRRRLPRRAARRGRALAARSGRRSGGSRPGGPACRDTIAAGRRADDRRGGGGMTARMVTYRVKDGRADENAAYVRDVMADLDARRTEGVTYSVYLLDDGVTFLHVVRRGG